MTIKWIADCKFDLLSNQDGKQFLLRNKGDIEEIKSLDYSSKTMKTEHGTFELNTPRDRNGSFEPELVKKPNPYVRWDREEDALII